MFTNTYFFGDRNPFQCHRNETVSCLTVLNESLGSVWTACLFFIYLSMCLFLKTFMPVLNWANVCSPNILRTVRQTMIHFLIELLVC